MVETNQSSFMTKNIHIPTPRPSLNTSHSSATVLPCGRPIPPSVPKSNRETSQIPLKESLERYFASKEFKQSESRNKLIDVVLQQTEHFTITELVKRVNKKHPQIGAATIYRNIPILLDAEILRETLTDDRGQKYYEVNHDEHHDHIVCLDCNRIFEFHDVGIEKAQDRIGVEMNFTAVKHKHVIFANCGFKRRKQK